MDTDKSIEILKEPEQINPNLNRNPDNQSFARSWHGLYTEWKSKKWRCHGTVYTRSKRVKSGNDLVKIYILVATHGHYASQVLNLL